MILRVFGASAGQRAVIKPHVRVKFPWKLTLGDHCWIGESVWIDNVDRVSIGSHSCISQGTYICTGNHRWDREAFDLAAAPVKVEDSCWIGAMSRIGPGVTIKQGSVVAMGAVVTCDTFPWKVHAGNPASPIKDRKEAQ